MISAFRVNIHYQALAPIIEKHADHTFGAFMDGTPFEEITGSQLKCLVLGNEGKGISPELQLLLNKRITIPRLGQAESLNVGVAAGILLQHFTKS
jgi:TrmH family RNA methyltransferase